ncbi:hypothetical protein RRG08_021227 [Elysia crispata]|uniref:Uncharacterized protein n=1 Tax=Elysia crispata TaxID=231223 RepID=A0AAE0YYJ0_9GAST|nr:hypothetical protein RRG08_021227 [Elysia crispata]
MMVVGGETESHQGSHDQNTLHLVSDPRLSRNTKCGQKMPELVDLDWVSCYHCPSIRPEEVDLDWVRCYHCPSIRPEEVDLDWVSSYHCPSIRPELVDLDWVS